MIKIVDIKEQLTKEKQLEDLREKVRARRKDSNEITVQINALTDTKRWLALTSKSLKLRGCVR
jgi:phosphomevalonate kinase